jgi:hypothetical protein
MSTKTHGHQHAKHVDNQASGKGLAVLPALEKQEISEEEQTRMIRVRAYSLWEKAGHPDGEAAKEQFWCEAEQEIAVSTQDK